MEKHHRERRRSGTRQSVTNNFDTPAHLTALAQTPYYIGALWGIALLCLIIVAVHGLWFMDDREQSVIAVASALHISEVSVTPTGHGSRHPVLQTARTDLRHTPDIPPEVLNTDTVLLNR